MTNEMVLKAMVRARDAGIIECVQRLKNGETSIEEIVEGLLYLTSIDESWVRDMEDAKSGKGYKPLMDFLAEATFSDEE